MNRVVLLFCVLLPFWSCANIQAPSGGPEDKTPPEVASFSPQNNTTNFAGKELRIRFTKYMNKAKVIENLSIAPIIPLKFDWSSKELRIRFDTELDTNLTYLINLGTDYTDLYGNKPESAFNLVFSAGSNIDSGTIAGKAPVHQPGYVALLYYLENKHPDTINPSHTLPDYRVQLGTSGDFTFSALKDGNYRLMLIKDEFRNNLYEPVDAYSSATDDIKVTGSRSVPIRIKPGIILDRRGPELREVYPEYGDFLVATFDEAIPIAYVKKENFKISDEQNREFPVASVISYPDEPNKILLSLANTLDTATTYTLAANHIVIRDSLGNQSPDSLLQRKFRPPTNADPTILRIFSFDLADSAGNLPLKPIFRFIFNRGINIDSAKINVKLTNEADGTHIKTQNTLKIANILEITPEDTLRERTGYNLAVTLGLIGEKNNLKLDTALTRYFSTGGRQPTGSASGTVEFPDTFCSGEIYLIFTAKDNTQYTTKVNANTWQIRAIPEGEYTVEAFCDLNSDGKYSYGFPFPFEFSEPFVIFENTLNIKARWSIEDIVFKINGN